MTGGVDGKGVGASEGAGAGAGTGGIAARIAEFASGLTLADVPPDVAEKARVCLLWAYGIGLPALAMPPVRQAAAVALAADGAQPGGATLLCSGDGTSPSGAAFANAVLIAARAQSDTCGAVHVGGIVVPVLTALSQTGGYPADRLLPALIVGFEVAGLLDLAHGGASSARGFRSTQVYGSIAAAAAAGRLMGLDAPAMASAISAAACFSGGLLEPFNAGSDEWRFQYGVAARAGLLAAQMARAGIVGAPRAIEGSAGLIRAFAGEDADGPALLAPLGRDWSIRRALFKPYPVCASNQTLVVAALALRDKLAGRAVARLRIDMNPFRLAYPGQAERGPFASVNATVMSVPFAVALSLTHGAPGVGGMANFDDAEVNRLCAGAELVADPAMTDAFHCRIRAVLPDGGHVEHAEALSPAHFAFDRARAAALARDCGAEAGVPAAAHDLIEAFADDPARTGIAPVLAAFSLARIAMR